MAENLEDFGDVRTKVIETAVKDGVAHNISSKRRPEGEGKFILNFAKTISEFENSMHKFPVKKVLYKSAFRGRGLEFESYRLHGEEDDASLIDWKASLRSNTLLAKQYVEERQLNVYFLVDVSSSMLFGSSDKLKAEYAAEFVASLSHLIVGSGDNIGMVMFNGEVTKILHPSSSKNQFALFMKALADPSFYGGGFDLNKAIDHVLRTISSQYTVFVLVSDFIRTKKSDLKGLRLMGSKFETFAVMIRDPVDENLPKTIYQFSIEDPYSGRQMILDPEIAAERYRKNALRQKLLIKEMMKNSRIDFLDLTTDRSFAMPLSIFLRNRSMGVRL